MSHLSLKSGRFFKVALLLGLLVAIIGASALLGWTFDIGALKTVLPGLVSMKANTALGVVLSGLTLTFLTREKIQPPLRYILIAAALLVTALGTVTLGEYFLGWNPGIDEILFREARESIDTSAPGRPSPATAFCFVLAGIDLGLLSLPIHFRFRLPVIAALAFSLVLLGGMTSVGQIAASFFHFEVWNYVGMAVHTAVSFIGLGFGLLAFTKGESEVRWALSKPITAGFILSLVIMFLAAGISWAQTRELQAAAGWVSHTHQVLREVENVRAGMATLESSERGYILIAEEHLLGPREQTKAEVDKALAKLRYLTADNPHQKPRLDELAPLITQRTDFGEQNISARRQHGLPAAQQMLATGDGIDLSASIDRVLGAIRNEEEALLLARQKKADVVSTATFLILPVVVFLSVTVLSLALFFLNAGLFGKAQAESALLKSEARLRRLFEQASDGIFVISANTRYLDANQLGLEMLGYTREELLQMSVADVVVSNQRERVAPAVAGIMAGRLHLEAWDHRRKDGTTFPAEVSARCLYDESFLAIVRDLTVRRNAEAALHESENKFRVMVDAIPQLAWMAKADGFIFWYNQRWYDYTGTTPEQMEGWGWQRVHDPNRLPTVLEGWKASIASGKPFDMEFPLRAADGHFGWFLTRVFPFKDDSGKVLNWFGTNTDVSQKREADEEIRRLNSNLEQRVANRTAELETANKELEAFSYSVAHDLRAPLRGIDGFSVALLEDHAEQLDSQGKEYLKRVRESAQFMAQLIDDLLMLAQVTQRAPRRERVNLSRLAKATVMRLEGAQPERKVEIIIADGLFSDGDERLLGIVLDNLLGNAWKFTAKRPKARIEFGRRQEAGRLVYFISDDGAGFDMAYASKLFGVFQRLHTVHEFDGTGIGLATVQRIISRHGGRIWAQGTVNQGATFYFTIDDLEEERL